MNRSWFEVDNNTRIVHVSSNNQEYWITNYPDEQVGLNFKEKCLRNPTGVLRHPDLFFFHFSQLLMGDCGRGDGKVGLGGGRVGHHPSLSSIRTAGDSQSDAGRPCERTSSCLSLSLSPSYVNIVTGKADLDTSTNIKTILSRP